MYKCFVKSKFHNDLIMKVHTEIKSYSVQVEWLIKIISIVRWWLRNQQTQVSIWQSPCRGIDKLICQEG